MEVQNHPLRRWQWTHRVESEWDLHGRIWGSYLHRPLMQVEEADQTPPEAEEDHGGDGRRWEGRRRNPKRQNRLYEHPPLQ